MTFWLLVACSSGVVYLQFVESWLIFRSSWMTGREYVWSDVSCLVLTFDSVLCRRLNWASLKFRQVGHPFLSSVCVLSTPQSPRCSHDKQPHTAEVQMSIIQSVSQSECSISISAAIHMSEPGWLCVISGTEQGVDKTQTELRKRWPTWRSFKEAQFKRRQRTESNVSTRQDTSDQTYSRPVIHELRKINQLSNCK